MKVITNSIREVATTAAVTSGSLAGIVAGVPADFDKWPSLAMMIFLCLSSLGVAALAMKLNAKAAEKREEVWRDQLKGMQEHAKGLQAFAVALTTQADRQGEENVRLNEMCEKQGQALDLLKDITRDLKDDKS